MKRQKQAVVVIHGIGEQRPLETLRSFVEAILPETNNDFNSKYRSKPDQMSESFELRCLQAPGNRNRPITDFYEYYWAHHMNDSKMRSVILWLLHLLIRPIRNIPKNLLPVYIITYLGISLAVIVFIFGIIDQNEQSILHRIVGIFDQQELYVSMSIIVIQLMVSRFFLKYVADAARYLNPTPENIEKRNNIRSEGIKLLRTLHESGKYFRILVVGHSLGSVIGYDILRHLWVELREPREPHSIKQNMAKKFGVVAKALYNTTSPIAEKKVEQFQQEQHKLWREHREIDIPWLVTDFITLGSPLTYSSLIMANSPKEFTLRKEDFEFPCCPPMPVQEIHYSKQYSPDCEQHPINVLIPHHGALFSSTRWTNLFFPHKKIILGDIIGGSLASSLGNGIRDIPVQPSRKGFLRKTLFSHVCYWETARVPSANETDNKFESLKALRTAMRLESVLSKDQWPKPTPFKLS